MSDMTRRELLSALAATPLLRQTRQDDTKRADAPHPALALARLLNSTQYSDLPPTVIDRAKMLIASTLASVASCSLISSVRIVRYLATEAGAFRARSRQKPLGSVSTERTRW